MEGFVYRVKIKDTLDWLLIDTTLSYELVDTALANAPQEIRDNGQPCELEIVGDEFVIMCPA